jgi:hypothetical protein
VNSESVIGDFNLDGKMDLVICGEKTDNYYSAVLINNDSYFSEMVISGLIPLSDASIEVFDINNDLYPDFIVSGRDYSGDKHILIFKNIQGIGFTKLNNNIQKLSSSDILSIDINNDGFMDIVYSGYNSNYDPKTLVYLNNKTNEFVETSHNIENFGNSNLSTVDFNNDGYMDILACGSIVGNLKRSYLYKNNNEGEFELFFNFEAISNGDVKWSDINNDGYSDLILAGYNGSDTILNIYKNTNSAFQSIQRLNIDLYNIEMDLVDFDNNNFLDIILLGSSRTGLPKTLCYTNHHALFTPSNIISENYFKSSICKADFNQDSREDLLIIGVNEILGNTNKMYILNKNITIPKPNSAKNLNYVSTYPKLKLIWEKPDGDESYTRCLKYIVQIGSTNSESEYRFCSSNPSSGFIIAKYPNSHDTTMTFDNLSEGKYFFSIQSIDIHGVVSDFSSPKLFYHNKQYSLGDDINVCKDEKLGLEVPKGNYLCNWYDGENNILQTNNNKLNININKDIKINVYSNRKVYHYFNPKVYHFI